MTNRGGGELFDNRLTAGRRRRYNARMRANKADDLSLKVMKAVLFVNGIFFIIDLIIKKIAQ